MAAPIPCEAPVTNAVGLCVFIYGDSSVTANERPMVMDDV
jgi:hypothetical protein